MLNHCLSWSKFVNTHLSHSRQWFNIHITTALTDSVDYFQHESRDVQVTPTANRPLNVHVGDEDGQIP